MVSDRRYTRRSNVGFVRPRAFERSVEWSRHGVAAASRWALSWGRRPPATTYEENIPILRSCSISAPVDHLKCKKG